MSDAKKRTVVVTGGTRGIGQGIVAHFASQGDLVIFTGRSSGDDTLSKVEQLDGKAVFEKLDITNESAVNDFFQKIQDSYGGCDVLINNAGIAKDFLFMRSKKEDWQSILDTNVMGALFCARAAVIQMMKKRWGRIINISSILGLTGNPGQSLYCTSKAALVGFTRSLAKEVGKRNITVNAVCPGFIETDMTDTMTDELKSEYLKRIPCGRLGSADDVAAVCQFLASEQASYVTGQALVVDGGLIA